MQVSLHSIEWQQKKFNFDKKGFQAFKAIAIKFSFFHVLYSI